MSVSNNCIECSAIIVDEWFFSCSGYLCTKVVDYRCATTSASKQLKKFPSDVRKGMKLVMDEVSGLRWFCPNCANGLNNALSSINESLANAGKSGDTKIDAILERMDKLEGMLEAVVHILSPSSARSEDRRVTRAMSRTTPHIDSHTSELMIQRTPSLTLPANQQDNVKPSNNILTTTASPQIDAEAVILASSGSTNIPSSVVPKASSEINATQAFDGSKSTVINQTDTKKDSELRMKSCDQPNVVDEYSFRVAQPRKWLFVSRIHESVSDEQFRRLLSKIVNIQGLVIQRIVPQASAGMIYDYVSYKINIPGDMFQHAINSPIWPAGLLVNEFDWGQKKAFFQQSRTRQQHR